MQRSYQEQVNQKDYQHKLYFKNGYPQNQSFKRDPKQLLRGLILKTCILHFLDWLKQGFNLWLFVVIILSASFKAKQQLFICIIQLAGNLFMSSYKLYQQICKALKQVNEHYDQTVYVIGWDPKCHISKCPKRDVTVGNLVFLKRHQPSPMSILILNSQEEKFMVQTSEKEGMTHMTQKQSIKLTSTSDQQKNQTLIYYKRILTGKIEFDYLDTNDNTFRGFIKLQKDPKGEYLDYRNIVNQSSMIINTDWVVGIVISHDDEDVIKMWQNCFKKSTTHFDRYLMKFSLIFSLLYFIQLAFCITIIVRFQNQPDDLNIYNTICRIFQSITFVHPCFITGLCEVTFQFFNNIFEKNKNIIVSHSSELLTLTKVDHCIYDKTGTLTNTNTVLCGVICGVYFYNLINEDGIRTSTKKYRKLMTTQHIHNNMQEILEEQEDQEENNIGIGSLQKSERFIQNPGSHQSVKSRLQSQHDEAISFNQDDAVFNEEEPESRNMVFNFNPHFIRQNEFIKPKKAQSVDEELSPPEKVILNKNNRRTLNNTSRLYTKPRRELRIVERVLEQTQDPANGSMLSPSPITSSKDFRKENKLGESQINEDELQQKQPSESDSDDNEEQEERKDLQEIIKSGQKQADNFMRSLILCQDVKTKYSKPQNKPSRDKNVSTIGMSGLMNEHPSMNPQNFLNENTEEYQESIIKFAKQYQFEFNCAGLLNKKICYEISAKGLSERYLVSKKVSDNETFAIFMKPIQQRIRNQANQFERQGTERGSKKGALLKLYVKSENLALLDKCKLSQKKRVNLEKQMTHQAQSGYRFIVYAGKDIPEDAVKNKNKYQETSFDTMEMTHHDKELIKDLDYYGLICLKEDQNPGAYAQVKTFKNLGISQWILSGDKKMQTLSAANHVGIVNNNNTLLRIDEVDEEKLKLQIKSQLLFIRKQLLKEDESQQNESSKTFATQKSISEMKRSGLQKKATFDENMIMKSKKGEEPLQKVFLLVNGKSIKTIFSDDYTKSHFLFIALILKTVIAYDCSSADKELITKAVTKIFEPSSTLLTISDSVDDFNMNSHANATIQFSKEKRSLKIAYQNIQVNDLQHIKQLVLYFAKILPMHLSQLTVMCTKISLYQLIILTLFVCVRKTLYIEEDVVYLLAVQIHIIINGLLPAFEDRSSHEQIELMLPQNQPQTYKCFKSNFRWLQELFYEALISAGITGLLNTYIFAEFMMFFTSDSNNLAHLMFLFQLFSVFAFGTSQMIHLNVPFGKIIWNLIITLGLLTISFAIVVQADLRVQIIRNIFKWQFIIGIITGIIIIITIDQIVKQTREMMFTPRIILNFVKFVETALKNYGGKVVSEQLKQFPITNHIKINRQFFRKIKKVFENVSIDPFIRSLFESEKTQSFNGEYSKFSLVFKNHNYEKQFRQFKVQLYYQQRREVVLVLFIVLRVSSVIAWAPFLTQEDTVLNILWAIVMMMWILILLITKVIEKKQADQTAFQIKCGTIEAYFFIPVVLILDHFLSVTLPEDKSQYYFSTFGQLLYQQFLAWDIFPPPLYYPITLTLIFFVNYTIRVGQFYTIQVNSGSETPTFTVEFITLYVLLFFLNLLSNYTHYNFQRFQRLVFLFDQALQTQQEQTNQILKSLLPAFIYEKIEQAEETQIEENQGSVSIIFLEICEFDKILQSKQRQVVSFLDDIFRVLDKICLQYGVQKIETVGKTYMACSGLKSTEIENNKDGLNQQKKNETALALELSLDFLKAVSEFRYEYKEQETVKLYKLKIKIGIHYGQVFAGVIGYHKPQFSLIGDTVNTASRMCSTGEVGRITISSEAYERVKDTEFLFTSREVEAKGKGHLIVHQVTQRKLQQKKHLSQVRFFEGQKNGRLLTFKTHKTNNSNIRSTQLKQTFKDISPPLSLNQNEHPTTKDYGRRSKIMNHPMQGSQMIKQPRKNKGPEQTRGNKKGTIKEDYTSISETVWKDRAKSQVIQKTDYNTNDWEETKEDEIQMKQVEKDPENRIVGVSDNDVDVPENEMRSEKIKKIIDLDILKYNKLTLEYEKCNDPNIVMQFEQYYQEVRSALKDIFYPMTIVYTLFKAQIQLLDSGYDGLTIYIVRMFLSLYLIILYFITSRLKKYNMHNLDLALTGLYYVSAFLTMFFVTFDNQQRFLISDNAEAYFFAFSAVNQQSLKFKYMFFYILLQQAAWFVQLLLHHHNNLLVFIVLSTIILVIVSHNNFELTIKNFNSAANENLKKEQRDSLLTNLLPSHILTRFYQNSKIKLELSDVLIDATLLFADISGFTAYSASVPAEQVVKMLRQLMTSFDKECLQQNVYKVYTIGDCYVVLGINDMEQRHPGQEAKNVLEMGLEMVEIIKRVRREISFLNLNMRIGIHTGQFYGGIIGTDIVRYDIFGVDAVIANKMESQGEAGKVMVSEDTRRLINIHFPGEYNFTYNKGVDIPVAKKKVQAYFATKADIQNRQDNSRYL
ncbi:unnamed protein product [Paramecium octaurelia]|uniref:Guanylate cyclase domain-containing protein n=1 Tax=Paramecium octaurelia TaxID=43137 RepID=A0A8S1SN03_PAROT|nr:unnamed protein product [Paramecium octaurelia]